MNRRMIVYMVGKIIMIEAALLVLPAVVAAIYDEPCFTAFLVSSIIALCIGYFLTSRFVPESYIIYAKDGFIIVAAAWVALSVIGTIPFVLSGEIPDIADAFFETVSGFTTTGATIATRVEDFSHAVLFWRSFTHWVGGMGVLVFVIAIVPNASADRSIHIMRAEIPGPTVGKLVPRASDTARILYRLYVVITVMQIILLTASGMPFFESLLNSFGTAGTGGLGVRSDSFAGYTHIQQWITTVFMFICGINFNVFYLLWVRRFRAIIRSEELWCYLGMVLVSIVVIALNIMPIYDNVSDSVRHSAFQVSSIITTTGYVTDNYDAWPQLSKGILQLLMIIGGCAGSTAGGLKQSRVILLFKMIGKEYKRILYPRSVGVIKFEGKKVAESTINGVGIYLAIYMACFCAVFLLLCFEPFDFETNFSAVVTCFNNSGPGFADVGPLESYAKYSSFSKYVMSFAMFAGRLEIYPILFLISPSTWARR